MSNILSYVANRQALQCQYEKPTAPVSLHKKLGKLLAQESNERKKVEVQKPNLMQLPQDALDYIF